MNKESKFDNIEHEKNQERIRNALAERLISELISEEKEMLGLIAKFRACDKEMASLCNQVSDMFMPLVMAAIERKDLREIERLLELCPCSVAKCFIMDAIRKAYPDWKGCGYKG